MDLEVTKHLYDIKNTLHQADKDFFQLFPVILTNNGGEFARLDDIEMDVRGESKLFFYDPNGSDQKSRIERLTLTSTIAELNLKRFQMRGFCALFFSIHFGYRSDEIKHD